MPDRGTAARRSVRRAAAEATAGTSVVLAGEARRTLLGAETARMPGIAGFKGLTAGEVILVATQRRVRVLPTGKVPRSLAGADVVAPALEDARLRPGLLPGLAGPTLGASALAGLAPVPRAAGITIVGREPLASRPNGENDRHLATKVERFRHLPG
ncbi:MAG: hypothetical protein ACREFO_11420 [Acetobacteraceae bacterium]